jgi:hypothetical protein
MVLEHVSCFLHGEGSAENDLISHKVAKCINKVLFQLPYKILNYYNCTIVRKQRCKG